MSSRGKRISSYSTSPHIYPVDYRINWNKDKQSAYYDKAEAKGVADSVQVPRHSGAATTTSSTGPIVDNDPL